MILDFIRKRSNPRNRNVEHEKIGENDADDRADHFEHDSDVHRARSNSHFQPRLFQQSLLRHEFVQGK